MMGRTHATSGAALWLAGCATAPLIGVHPQPGTVLLGATVCAGAALLPDVDHPCSTVAYSCGPFSRLVARGVGRLSARVHAATRTRLDRPDQDGHRTCTHTAVFALAAGVLSALACGLGGRWATLGLVAALLGLGWSAMFRRGAIAASVLAVAVAWASAQHGGWWLGVPVAAGCLAHCLGDALTNSGCPILWPLTVQGRRWFPVGPPRACRFGTGGGVERWLVLPLLLVSVVGSGWLLADGGATL